MGSNAEELGLRKRLDALEQERELCEEKKIELFRAVNKLKQELRDGLIDEQRFSGELAKLPKSPPQIIIDCNEEIRSIGENAAAVKKQLDVLLGRKRKERIAAAAVVAVVVLLSVSALFLTSRLTGFATREDVNFYTVQIAANFTQPQQYVLSVSAANVTGELRRLALGGRLIGQGEARVYLQKGDTRLLVFDTAALLEKGTRSLVAITGMAVSDLAGTDNESGGESATASANENEANATLQLPELPLPGIPASVEKAINISLAYKQGSEFDSNDDGVEPDTSAIDFTVGGTNFSWAAEGQKLCTRWVTASLDNNTQGAVCYGSADCCALVELSPEQPDWNDAFELFVGRYGASYNNTVSSQVIFADYSLEPGNVYSEIQYSSFSTLSATFVKPRQLEGNITENATLANVTVIEFSNVCVETCSLAGAREGLNLSRYTLVIEVENATLALDNATYTLANVIEVDTEAPVVEILLPGNITYNETIAADVGRNTTALSLNFTVSEPAEWIGYSLNGMENATIAANTTIRAANGTNTLILYATDLAGNTGSSMVTFSVVFSEALKARNITSGNATAEKLEVLFQGHAEIGMPVKWVKLIRQAKKSNTSTSIPAAAAGIAVRENNVSIEDKVLVEERGMAAKLREHPRAKQPALGATAAKGAKARTAEAEGNITIVIEKNVTEIEVEYETPAPTATEKELDRNRKQVTVSSEVHYENITAYATITESPEESVKLYWLKTMSPEGDKPSLSAKNSANNTREEVADVAKQDTNADGLTDRLEWTVPYLSNQTYEIVINITTTVPFNQYQRAICRDGRGMIHIAWRFNTTSVAWANSSDNGTTWSVNDSLYAGSSANTRLPPHISCDGNNITVAYEDSSADDVMVGVSTSNGAGWTWANPVTTGVTNDVSVERRGTNIYVVYVDALTNRTVRFINSTDGGATWGTQPGFATITAAGTIDAARPALAVDGNGSGSDKIYIASELTDFNVWFINSTDSGATWGGQVRVSGTGAAPAQGLSSITYNGSNIYVALLDATTPTGVKFANSTDGSAWRNYTIDATGNISYSPSITTDQFGYPWVFWEQNVSDGVRDIVYRRFNGTDWEPAQNITFSAGNPKINNTRVNTKTVFGSGRIDLVYRTGNESGPFNITYKSIDLAPVTGALNITLASSNVNISQNSTFTINASVLCRNGNCHQVNATPYFNWTGPIRAPLNDTRLAVPFFNVSGFQNQTCGSFLSQNQDCSVNWTVNATGPIGSNWLFTINFTSNNSAYVATNGTSVFGVNISAGSAGKSVAVVGRGSADVDNADVLESGTNLSFTLSGGEYLRFAPLIAVRSATVRLENFSEFVNDTPSGGNWTNTTVTFLDNVSYDYYNLTTIPLVRLGYGIEKRNGRIKFAPNITRLPRATALNGSIFFALKVVKGWENLTVGESELAHTNGLIINLRDLTNTGYSVDFDKGQQTILIGNLKQGYSDSRQQVILDPTVQGSCGTLSAANTEYQLSQDLDASGTCLTIGADNVTLDCLGYTVGYANQTSGYGISITGYNTTVVRNCVLLKNNASSDTQGSAAIFASRSNNSIFLNNTINSSGNISVGFSLNFANHTNITSNLINTSGNLSHAYGQARSQYSNITQNVIKTRLGRSQWGINLTTSSFNNVFDNDINTSGIAVTTINNYGIYVTVTSNSNNISNNLVNTSGTGSNSANYGIYALTTVSNNYISGNTVRTNGSSSNTGILLRTTANNNVVHNNVIIAGGTAGSQNGVQLFNPNSGNNITSNTITASGASTIAGIDFVAGNNNNIIANNTISVYGTSYTNYGIHLLTDLRNEISENIIKTDGIGVASRNYGIWLQTSTNGTKIRDNNITTSGTGIENLGIYFSNSASNNNITGNNITTGGTTDNHGIYFITAANDNNTISGNIIRIANATSHGIYISTSNYSKIENNTIILTGDGSIGMIINKSLGNRIYNNLINTTARHINVTTLTDANNFSLDAITAGTNIVGGANLGGNFYDNSTSGGQAAWSKNCTDADADGICDTSLTHETENVDFFPLTVTSIVANSAPIVFNDSVALNSSVTLTDGGNTEFTVRFNVTDADGTGNMNNAAAGVNITFNGVKRSNNSGNCEAQDNGATTRLYTCIVVFWYFDNSSSIWDINLSAADTTGAVAHNDSNNYGTAGGGGAAHNLTINSLSAFSIVSSSIAATTSINAQNVELSFAINNTGNFDFTLINVTPTDLNASLTDFFRLEGNFSVNATASTSDGFGTGLLNSTPTNFSDSLLGGELSATLPHKITGAEADFKANRTLYIYIDIPQNKGLSTGVTYNASPSYPWQVILGTPS